MKKSMMVTGISLAVLGAMGYGAWMMFKNQNPTEAHALQKDMNKMSKNVAKSKKTCFGLFSY